MVANKFDVGNSPVVRVEQMALWLSCNERRDADIVYVSDVDFEKGGDIRLAIRIVINNRNVLFPVLWVAVARVAYEEGSSPWAPCHI